jgi:uncharacterized membrane-anchored protein YhcB (DUF1043 family)
MITSFFDIFKCSILAGIGLTVGVVCGIILMAFVLGLIGSVTSKKKGDDNGSKSV